ncbi:MAG: CsgG/HfaB family protein [Desulforhabdus sp.]|nr:CsgG/HfaB family protein [Desulforhabdus sp.]
MRTSPSLILISVSLMLFAGQGCERNYIGAPIGKETKSYPVTKRPFRGRWWNYYERALSYQAERYWKQAEADLREALRRRERDQRRARTYGMHFINYFPHRELGIVLFYQGRFEEAAFELEESLSSESSAKAQFYLDLTRKQKILKESQDTSAPDIQISSPAGESFTNSAAVLVKGVATDDCYVKSVEVNGQAIRIDLSAPKVPFETYCPLKSGKNLIRVAAKDLVGKTSQQERVVWADWQGPVLSIDEPVEGVTKRTTQVRITGYVSDTSGVREIKVNDRQILGGPVKEFALSTTVDLTPAQDTIRIEAQDLAGNHTRAEIKLLPELALRRYIQLAAIDPFHLIIASAPSEAADRTSPRVELKNWMIEQEVFLDQIYLEGRVWDEDGVRSLKINGQEILRRKGSNVYFGYLAILHPGNNEFSIEAEDTAGNRTEKKLAINRKLRKIHALESRLTVALLPLERKNDREELHDHDIAVEETLLQKLIDRSRFHMVERQRLEEVLTEHKLSCAHLVDEKNALQVGRMLAARCVLMGTVVTGGNSLEIFVRVVDTETSLVIAAVDVYGEDVDDPLTLEQLCQGLALKLCDELPLVEGLVIRVKGDRIDVDLGSNQRVKTGMLLTIFEEGEPIIHPVTGETVGADVDELGEAVIKMVGESMSEGEIRQQAANTQISPMQHVITQ